jgi:hypothetical protein
MTDPWVVSPPVRPVRSGWPERPDRPHRPSRPDAGVYRRRRAVALLALVAVALGATLAFRQALAGPGGGALTITGSSGAASAPPMVGQVYVVQPGDSLWSIVRGTGHGGDPRPQVDRLAAQLHGRPLLPGERLVVR